MRRLDEMRYYGNVGMVAQVGSSPPGAQEGEDVLKTFELKSAQVFCQFSLTHAAPKHS